MVLAVILIGLLAALALAFGINLSVHGSDGKRIDWSKMGPAVLLLFLGGCWTWLTVMLVSRV